MDVGMVHYDGRAAATVPISRPELTQHYLPGILSRGSMPAPFSPQYNNSYSSQPMLWDCLERQPRVLPVVESPVQQRTDGLPIVQRSRTPSLQSEARSRASDLPSPETDPPSLETITVPSQGLPIHRFHTPIDNLVMTIEVKSEVLNWSDRAELVQADEEEEVKITQV